MPNEPRDLDVDEDRHQFYRELTEAEDSPFYGRTMKDVFVFAAGYGFYYHSREKLRKKRGTIPLSAFSDEDKWLLMSIGIADQNSLDVLFDVRQVYEIGQEYANGGITILRNAIMSGQPGDPHKLMETEIRNILASQRPKVENGSTH